MCPVTTTNSLPVVFRACSVRALSCPSSWPPQKPVSICLASPAMTQHWLTTEHAHTHTYMQTHTSSRRVPLGAWPSLFPGFSLSFILSVLCYEYLQMCLHSCFLYFYLNWEPHSSCEGKQEGQYRLVPPFSVLIQDLWPHRDALLLYYCFARQPSAGDDRKKQANSNTLTCKWKTFLQSKFPHSCLSFFLTLLITPSSSSSSTMPTFISVTHSRWYTDCFLHRSHVLYRNLAQLFPCTVDTTSSLRNYCAEQLWPSGKCRHQPQCFWWEVSSSCSRK